MVSVDSKAWNSEHENILKEWKARSFVSMWLQLKSGYFYMRLNDFVTYPVIIFSSISSAALFASNNDSARFAIAIISIINVIITGLMIEFSPGEKIELHMACMKKYSSLIRNIDYCLSIPPALRADPITFIDRVNTQMDYIADSEIITPRYVVRRFEKNFGTIESILYGEEIAALIADDIKHLRIATNLNIKSKKAQ